MLNIYFSVLTGGGIYAQSSLYSNSIAMANNSALVWKSSTYNYEMDIYCMSNSSSSSTGSVMTPSSNPLSTTSCGVGCYQMYSTSSSLSSTYQGIYTCRIADSNGDYLDFNFGIYPYSYRYICKYTELCLRWYTYLTKIFIAIPFTALPVVTSLQQDNTNNQFALICVSTTSPAMTVVWTKDGITLSMDGAPYQHSQIVTDRRSSTYQNILTSSGDPDSIVGNYSCTVSNRFGSSGMNVEIQG